MEHSRSREKHTTASRVFPYTSFVQQNTAQSRLLYLFNCILETTSVSVQFSKSQFVNVILRGMLLLLLAITVFLE